MAHRSLLELANSSSLVDRMIAGAAMTLTDPVTFVKDGKWSLVSDSSWSEAWEKAKEDWTVVASRFHVAEVPDFGLMEDVITDEMINDAIIRVAQEIADSKQDDETPAQMPVVPSDN